MDEQPVTIDSKGERTAPLYYLCCDKGSGYAKLRAGYVCGKYDTRARITITNFLPVDFKVGDFRLFNSIQLINNFHNVHVINSDFYVIQLATSVQYVYEIMQSCVIKRMAGRRRTGNQLSG